MDGKELKRLRVFAEIPATLLSARSGVERSRLSAIERATYNRRRESLRKSSKLWRR